MGLFSLKDVMDAVRYIMKDKFQFSHLYNYIDDLIYTGLPDNIYESYNTLIEVLQKLGLPSKH